jgi:hypothetical protein
MRRHQRFKLGDRFPSSVEVDESVKPALQGLKV